MKKLTLFAMLAVGALSLSAAETEKQKFFKLDFTVKEMEAGKTLNSHTYSIRAGTNMHNTDSYSIRAGTKIPLRSSAAQPSQFTYYDVGVNFDIRRLEETDGEISFAAVADASTAVAEPDGLAPVIRQNKWNATVSAKVGKPTVIFSSDDLSSKRQMVVEVTATPIH